MPIAKATCPECGAKLSSADGFDIGEEVECPKCERSFKVRAPKLAPAPVKVAPKAVKPQVIDDEDDEEEEEEKPRPKSKKSMAKRRRDEDDDEDYEDERPRSKKKKAGGYKNSPIRFVVLGVLVIIMAVMGYFLVRKIMAERAANARLHQTTGTSLARTATQTSAITLVAVA